MGLVSYVAAAFRCVRCSHTQRRTIQTKLFHVDSDNASMEYEAGHVVTIDGLSDYWSLHRWNGLEHLVVGMGDWDCIACGLNWQWARVEFQIVSRGLSTGVHVGEIRRVDPLIPFGADSLHGIHFVEEDLADLAWFHDQDLTYNVQERAQLWAGWSTSERARLLAAGFRAWGREVAGLTVPHPGTDLDGR